MSTAVSKSQDTTVLPAAFVRRDERGDFVEAINQGPWETVITGTMRTGAVIGNHYHRRTRMFFFLPSGSAQVTIVDVKTNERRIETVSANFGVFLEPNQAHAIRFLQDSTFLLLKSHPYVETDPDTYDFPVLTNSALKDEASRPSPHARD